MIELDSMDGVVGRQRSKDTREAIKHSFYSAVEVDPETLVDMFRERFAIAVHDAGLDSEDAKQVGLDGLRRTFRVFLRNPMK